MLIQRRRLETGHTLIHGDLTSELKEKARDGLDAAERVLLMQSSPLLAHATAAQLWRLSAIARPIDLQPGVVPLARGGEAAILVVISGEVKVEAAGAEAGTAMAGDVIGMFETLGGSPLGATLTVTAPGTALRLERQELFELLADHTDLLQGVFSGLLRRN